MDMDKLIVRGVGIVAVVVAAGAMPACSCSHNNNMGFMDMGSGAGDDLAAPAVAGDLGPIQASGDGGCSATGDTCDSDSACCSGHCDATSHLCAVGACRQAGASCVSGTDCCNLNCAGGTCRTAACVSDNQACTAGGAACCSSQCVSGTCKPLNPSCKTAGNDCAAAADCCSKTCTNGKCAAPSTVSYCTQPGDICAHDNECCTGVCTIGSGATVGTCATLNSPCSVDGTVCMGCTGCCSSFCAPFGASTSHICQPAGGCHVLGDLCLKDIDCCGGDPTNQLPGAGLVRCIPDPAHPQIGTCSMANPNYCPVPPPKPVNTCQNTCQPEGDVCHSKALTGCPSNSFPNNCCSAPGNKGFCQLDAHGVPRCHGIGACVMPGGACASTGDCCNNVPCVPGPGGGLVCGQVACVPPAGVCTATTDCCTGYACIVPPGSTTGTCVNPNPPPTVPADMAGSNGGNYDLSTPPPMCALVAQTCSTTTPCCANNGNCVTAAGMTCTAGATCTCVAPIQ